MFNMLAKLFHKEEVPPPPFVDAILGQFQFERGLGWKKNIAMAGREVELVLGSDSEPPSNESVQMARSWVTDWPLQRAKVVDYIHCQLREWSDEPNLPVPEKFEVESIIFLWEESPKTCMIYFNYPGDEFRVWHVTFNGFDPQGFAYDD